MECVSSRILLASLFIVVSFSTLQPVSQAQECKFQAASAGKPASCTSTSSTGRCSPVDIGSTRIGTCRLLPGDECICAPGAGGGPTPTPAGSPHPTPTPHATPTPAPVPLRGFVDLHTHPLANLGFGGKLFYGGVDVGSLLPADPDCKSNVRAATEAQALGHDKSTHGGHDFFSNTCGDELRKATIHGIQKGHSGPSNAQGADESEDASGFPNFPEWPVWNDLTHQKMWVEWIRRAHQGGLRVMVALAVNNKTLGDMTAGPGDYATDDKSSADRQIAEIKSFVGRHPDFMEIALSSLDVHRIVSGNKLAVVIGIEVDHIGNFQTPDSSALPAAGEVKFEIDRLYGEGVRYIFPIHILDNAFGGTAAYTNLFNVSNIRESGHPYSLVCAPKTDDINYIYNNSDIDVTAFLGQIAKLGVGIAGISYPHCATGQKNSLGLSETGKTAIKEMMRLGMLIDIDHMSQAAADDALTLAKSLAYPVNSGHNGLRGTNAGNHNERSFRADQYLSIGQLHGMAGVGSAGLDSQQWLALHNAVVSAMGGGNISAAFGTDTDGLALGMPPRLGTHPPQTGRGPLYPQYEQCLKQCDCPADSKGKPDAACIKACTSNCGKQFPQAFVNVPASGVQYTASFPASQDGGRTWDLKTDGVAHYGMLWDFLEDVKLLPGGATTVDSSFMNGAEYFYQTWRIAEARSASVK